MKNELKLISMDTVETENVQWLWYPYIPLGKITIVHGDPGEGKTTFALAVIASLTKGEPLPECEEAMEPMNVIYQTAEDGLADTIKPRLVAAGADCARVMVIDETDKELTQISKRLEKEQIPTPAYYYYQKYGVALTGLNLAEPYKWSDTTVGNILEDETYLGHTVNLKSTTMSFKNKKRIERPESEQLRFENTHEALVDKQTWDIVRDVRKHKRRRANFAEQNIFSGLVYCMDCGGTMVLHRAHTMDAVKNNFMCSTYKKKGKDVCSGHYIREIELEQILLDDIRRITHFARQNEMRFAAYIGIKLGKEAQREITALQKKVDAMTKRQSELSALFKRLYEDSVLGRIPDEQYRILSAEYITEQKSIQEELPEAQARLTELKDSEGNALRFIENARKYTEITELTSEILHTFIQRVEVGERAERYSRTAPQEIRIYYRDIGIVDDIPETMDISALYEEYPDDVA